MEQWSELRRRVLVEGVSRRQVMRETGMHWRTLAKILTNSEPPGYRLEKARERPKLGPYLGRIEAILKEDAGMPRKQRHTAKRIWQRLREWGYTGGYTVVKELVREMGTRTQEVFVPLVHPPGEAQVDFGHALVKLNGKLAKVAFFVMALPYSDAVFVMAFERECTETFWEGHVRAFEFFGGVHQLESPRVRGISGQSLQSSMCWDKSRQSGRISINLSMGGEWLEGGWGGDNLAEWKWRIHRHFYHPAINQ